MIGKMVSCLVFFVSQSVHTVEEKTVSQWHSFDSVHRVETNEIVLVAQLVNLEMLRPAHIDLLLQWELDVWQDYIRLLTVQN